MQSGACAVDGLKLPSVPDEGDRLSTPDREYAPRYPGRDYPSKALFLFRIVRGKGTGTGLSVDLNLDLTAPHCSAECTFSMY